MIYHKKKNFIYDTSFTKRGKKIDIICKYDMKGYTFNGLFFKHLRKDYINSRNYILRYLSMHYYYTVYREVKDGAFFDDSADSEA
jgi:hypothetical protein